MKGVGGKREKESERCVVVTVVVCWMMAFQLLKNQRGREAREWASPSSKAPQQTQRSKAPLGRRSRPGFEDLTEIELPKTVRL